MCAGMLSLSCLFSPPPPLSLSPSPLSLSLLPPLSLHPPSLSPSSLSFSLSPPPSSLSLPPLSLSLSLSLSPSPPPPSLSPLHIRTLFLSIYPTDRMSTFVSLNVSTLVRWSVYPLTLPPLSLSISLSLSLSLSLFPLPLSLHSGLWKNTFFFQSIRQTECPVSRPCF